MKTNRQVEDTVDSGTSNHMTSQNTLTFEAKKLDDLHSKTCSIQTANLTVEVTREVSEGRTRQECQGPH